MRDLFGAKAQVLGPQLHQFAAGPQPRQRQLRVNTRADNQVQLRRQVLQKIGHGAVNGFSGDGVVVVQHKSDFPSFIDHEVIRQQSQHRLKG